MKKTITLLEKINEFVGNTFSWSIVLMILTIFFDVVFRYLFNFTFLWIYELEIYFFALSFIIMGGYAFKHDNHVRVDIFYANLSTKKKAWVDLFGNLFFLLPWTLVCSWVTYTYALNSFNINESSVQPGGLPAVYILKFIVFFGFVLLLLQCIANSLQCILTLKNK